MSTANIEKNKETLTSGINSQRLNLILAICGIVIALASFYATYLQAEAADKQVKAMTMPLLEFTHGNIHEQLNISAVTFTINNAGIGPALIKSVKMKYQNKYIDDMPTFYATCCFPKAPFETYQDKINVLSKVNATTSPVTNTILAGQDSNRFLSIAKTGNDPTFWDKIDKARSQFSLEICYCSMLDECYITEKNGVIDPVEQCSTIKNH